MRIVITKIEPLYPAERPLLLDVQYRSEIGGVATYVRLIVNRSFKARGVARISNLKKGGGKNTCTI